MQYEAKIIIYTIPLEAANAFEAKASVNMVFEQFIETLNLSQIKKHVEVQVREIGEFDA